MSGVFQRPIHIAANFQQQFLVPLLIDLHHPVHFLIGLIGSGLGHVAQDREADHADHQHDANDDAVPHADFGLHLNHERPILPIGNGLVKFIKLVAVAGHRRPH